MQKFQLKTARNNGIKFYRINPGLMNRVLIYYSEETYVLEIVAVLSSKERELRSGSACCKTI
jgi:hypothetical protein